MIPNDYRIKGVFYRGSLYIIIFTFLIFCIPWCTKERRIKYDISKNAMKFISYKEKRYLDLNKTDIVRLINKYNKEQKILNLDFKLK